MSQWIDIHCHLDMLGDDLSTVLEVALSRNVGHVITIGTEPEDHPKVLKYSQQYAKQVSCTIGVHPHHGTLCNDQIIQSMIPYFSKPEVIAVGEIGLDYFYKTSPPEDQKKAFRAQMELAAQFQLPVEIHTRDAEPDTVEILSEFKERVVGVIHCFTSSGWLARQALDLGYNISLSGVVTFKNAEELRQTARTLPLDRIHVETDSPFLSPIPHRGKKNTPAFVVDTGAFLAKELKITAEELRDRTTENTLKMFPKLAHRWNPQSPALA